MPTPVPECLEVEITAVVVGERHRKELGDLDLLAQSIREVGLLQPIGITPDRTLVFGQRRLEAARKILGWTHIPARILPLDRMLDGEHAENEHRKALTPSERVAIGKALEMVIAERRGGRNPANRADLKGKETAEIAAVRAGFGNPESYRQASRVVELGVPALVEAMDSGAVSKADAAVLAKEPKARQLEVLKGGDASVKAVAAASRKGRKKQGEARRKPSPKVEKSGDTFIVELSPKTWREQILSLFDRHAEMESYIQCGLLIRLKHDQ